MLTGFIDDSRNAHSYLTDSISHLKVLDRGRYQNLISRVKSDCLNLQDLCSYPLFKPNPYSKIPWELRVSIGVYTVRVTGNLRNDHSEKEDGYRG